MAVTRGMSRESARRRKTWRKSLRGAAPGHYERLAARLYKEASSIRGRKRRREGPFAVDWFAGDGKREWGTSEGLRIAKEARASMPAYAFNRKRRRYGYGRSAPYRAGRKYGKRYRTRRLSGRRRTMRAGRMFRKIYKRRTLKVTPSDLESVVTWRQADSGVMKTILNEVNYTSFSQLTSTEIELAISEGHVLQTDAAVMTKVKVDMRSIKGLKIKVLGAKSVLKMRNNFTIPCCMEVWWVGFKQIENNSPKTLVEEGIADVGVANGDRNIRTWPTDSPRFRKSCKIYRHKKYRLDGGDEVELQLNRRAPLLYNPDELDRNTNFIYIPHITSSILIRLVGCISHEASDHDAVGTSAAAVDWLLTTSIRFSCSGGVRLKTIEQGALTYDTMTTPNVCAEDTEIVAGAG